uniref:Uncharacterized protein LOC111126491 n=1 Tax=Crassostrea virginica TaxID=6565 RepID=A0A8B8DH37_CRAVI|nr:uncharacterized protein LOC111126491 [Crassostrea virginica]
MSTRVYPCLLLLYLSVQTPQTALCQAQWAFLGTVQGFLNFTGDDGKAKQKYEIYINKVIKDTGKIKLKDKAITPVITPLDDCAVHIEKDVKAIFTGSYDGLGSPTMNKCNWYEDYSNVPKCQRRNLFKKLYLKNCSCSVCLPGECPTDSTPHCVLRSQDDCDNKHSHCAIYPGCNKCSWKRCVSYYDCEDDQLLPLARA